MIQEFNAPDRIMVGTRGAVGARLFLFQVREGRRLLIIKFEKLQLAAIADWIGTAIKEFTRPGHLPDDFSLEPEYSPDFDAGDVTLAIDPENEVMLLTIESSEEDDSVTITLTKEMAGGLAIAIARLVEAGRPPCPLCALPLDPRGHDCPRTNGYRPPIR